MKRHELLEKTPCTCTVYSIQTIYKCAIKNQRIKSVIFFFVSPSHSLLAYRSQTYNIHTLNLLAEQIVIQSTELSASIERSGTRLLGDNRDNNNYMIHLRIELSMPMSK